MSEASSLARVADLRVREAAEWDLEAVVGIEQQSFSDPWSRESFATSLALDRICFLVAEEESAGPGGGACELVGYVIALLVGEEGEIADVAVCPSARGRGVGGCLLDRALADSADRGVRTMYLEVRESNVAARALYESRSFEVVGRRKGYYQRPPEDALVMKREDL